MAESTNYADIIIDEEGTTYRAWFEAVCNNLIFEADSFSGKRPLGESGWLWELAAPLVRLGLIAGSGNDEDGWEPKSWGEFDAFMREKVIPEIFATTKQALENK